MIRLFLVLIFYNFSLIKCESDAKHCSTQACQREAEYFRNIIDPSVDPCDDFYKHICGGFIKNTTIPDDKSYVDSLSKLDENLKIQLSEVLSSPINEDDIEPFKLTKIFYKSCMNKDLIEQRGLEPIKKQLEALGGWPVVEGKNWQENVWSWQKILLELQMRGFDFNFIFDCSIQISMKNSTTRVIVIDQMSFGLDREYLVKGFNDTKIQAYYSYQVDSAVIFGADRFNAELEMKDILDFEIRLAEISKPKEERRNMTNLHNPITVKEFQPLFPIHDWHKFLNQVFKNSNITQDEVIIMTDFQEIVNKLYELLKVTPNRVIVNYILWRATATMPNFLNNQIRDRFMELRSIITGQKTFLKRELECANRMISYLPVATSALYVKHFFENSSKDVAMELVNAIQEEFDNSLKSTDWMDEVTKKEALQKSKLMKHLVGYPNELTDNSKLIEYHENLMLEEDKYFEAILNLQKFDKIKILKNFRKPVNKTDWESHALVAILNAFYESSENSVQIPAGILQGVMFSSDRPKYLNYGAIGTIIGHEISHGFDDEGSQYDGDGNVINWWQEDTKQAYLEKARCIVDQYSSFTESTTGLNVNGINTQGENIADNIGFIASYRAYLRNVERYGEELPLSGLNYTSRQLFWVSFAASWCSTERPESKQLSITTNEHSPEEFRVNGVAMNMPEFSEDFGCLADSYMNPKKKCHVW